MEYQIAQDEWLTILDESGSLWISDRGSYWIAECDHPELPDGAGMAGPDLLDRIWRAVSQQRGGGVAVPAVVEILRSEEKWENSVEGDSITLVQCWRESSLASGRFGHWCEVAPAEGEPHRVEEGDEVECDGKTWTVQDGMWREMEAETE